MNTNTLKINELEYINFSTDKRLLYWFEGDKAFENMLDKKVKLLSNKSSMMVWLYIFGEEVQAHTQWFVEDHWMNHTEKKCININWNHYSHQTKKIIEEALKRNFSYKLENKVFFFNAPMQIIETTWEVFIQYWDEFFNYDDEAFIWCFDQTEVLMITPHGDIVKYFKPTE